MSPFLASLSVQFLSLAPVFHSMAGRLVLGHIPCLREQIFTVKRFEHLLICIFNDKFRHYCSDARTAREITMKRDDLLTPANIVVF